ncbi:Transcriptional regulatory protein SrrA [compost metagenome]
MADLLRTKDFDLILMDIMLPNANGLELLSELRRRQRVPVILMSALGAEQDRIAGFSQGADDYLSKPFSMVEMDVRIDAILRRVAYDRQDLVVIVDALDLTFDSLRKDVSNNGQWAGLTSTEYRVLETLARHPNEALSKTFLYQEVLHRAYSQHDRGLDMHVSHIRSKLLAIGYQGGRIETVRGTGYMFARLPL